MRALLSLLLLLSAVLAVRGKGFCCPEFDKFVQTALEEGTTPAALCNFCVRMGCFLELSSYEAEMQALAESREPEGHFGCFADPSLFDREVSPRPWTKVGVCSDHCALNHQGGLKLRDGAVLMLGRTKTRASIGQLLAGQQAHGVSRIKQKQELLRHQLAPLLAEVERLQVGMSHLEEAVRQEEVRHKERLAREQDIANGKVSNP
eukprot:gnl/Hemi2/10733_TR3688_c0_g1_i1.p1 gnl/Hemi2/10733_TR3688_c0_g1~~gnl/Hemi2/10733_TR3688_c0_g1_i1.p1  ORF type:complete len:205 (+),score=55.56 gnl/Hemi2/10733_TR3688_c0_g1_i1:55-669(+)